MSNPYRNRIVGVDRTVPLADGRQVPYANLDNAASTPALFAAKRAADALLEMYASIHRGAGYKSQVASEWYERSREVAMDFVNADPDRHCAVFTMNTTDSINRLARMLPHDNDRSVVISEAEHHANDLPWRAAGRTVRVPVTPEGFIDPDDLDRTLQAEGRRVRLVSLTGASNVIGTVQPVHELAKVAHRHGVPIAVDAAQLAPHKPVSMRFEDGEQLDFLFLSGHKMYAPFGGGLLVGPKEMMKEAPPALRGGGAVLVVESQGVDWADPPEREEAGSPNVMGAITLAAAMKELNRLGFEALDEVELRLTRRFLAGLEKIEGARVYGITDEAKMDRRLGVIAFNIGDVPHDLVATVLAHEDGIGVRNGCFCAHPFVMQLVGVSDEEARAFRERVRRGDKSDVPGMVRLSFGLYNTEAEVDRALAVLERIGRGELLEGYQRNGSGVWQPKAGAPDYGAVVDRLWNEVLTD